MKVSKAKTKVCPYMSDNTIGRDVYGKYNVWLGFIPMNMNILLMKNLKKMTKKDIVKG